MVCRENGGKFAHGLGQKERSMCVMGVGVRAGIVRV